MIQTEYPFSLPIGYQDDDGELHRHGTMRLATAADEILPLKESRVQANPAYLLIILLSRVITELEGVEHINPKVVEGLYAADLAYLQELYNQINRHGNAAVPASCPRCEHQFTLELTGVGGSSATP